MGAVSRFINVLCNRMNFLSEIALAISPLRGSFIMMSNISFYMNRSTQKAHVLFSLTYLAQSKLCDLQLFCGNKRLF